MTNRFLQRHDAKRNESYHIAYQSRPGDGVGIMFLCGHGSDMYGSKAEALDAFCQVHNLPFTRFDYFGHGESDGAFLDGTISRWTDDALAILDEVTSGPQILVGSSLGGWIMLNVGVQRRQRIAGLIGIAAAPDFTERLIWDSLTPAQQKEMKDTGQIALPNPYAEEDVIYPYHLIEDGRDNLRLTQTLAIGCPLTLHQGMQDHEVPWHTALEIADKAETDDVTINLVKNAGHRFSSEDEIAALLASVTQMVDKISRPADED